MTRRGAGFTLLELVATLVLFGLVAVMGVSFWSSGVTRTDIPVRQLQNDAGLQLVLENMIADKERRFDGDLNGLSAAIGGIGTQQTTYGNGVPYYIAEKHFVCPQNNALVPTPNADQFLLVTIKSSADAADHLTYLFSSTTGTCPGTGGGN